MQIQIKPTTFEISNQKQLLNLNYFKAMTTIQTFETPLVCPIETTLANWEVREVPIFTNYKAVSEPMPKTRKIDGYKAIVRDDSHQVLNLCSPAYHAMSNRQFIETAIQFSEVTGFPLENIFEVDGGAKQLAFLKCTETFHVNGFEFKDHLMIGNSHDGTTGFFVGNSNLMIRCQNRFARQYRSLKVKHTKSLQIGVDQIKQEFANYRHKLNEYYSNLDKMSKIKVSKKLIELMTQRLASMSREEIIGTKELSTRKKNIVSDLNDCFESEMAEVGSTVLGLFEGATYYTTHKAKVYSTDENAPGVFDRAYKLNEIAYDFCLEQIRNFN